LKKLVADPAIALVVSKAILFGLLTPSVTTAEMVPLLVPVVPMVTAAFAADAAVRAAAPASAMMGLRIEMFLTALNGTRTAGKQWLTTKVPTAVIMLEYWRFLPTRIAGEPVFKNDDPIRRKIG
jgi:hypothetical protein